MKAHLLPSNVSLATFDRILAKYDDQVPERLAELEELRLHTLPDAIAQRRKDGEAYIAKDELKSLVEWKLYGILFYIYSDDRGYVVIDRSCESTFY